MELFSVDVVAAVVVPPFFLSFLPSFFSDSDFIVVAVTPRSTEWDEWFSGRRDETPETDADGNYVSQIPVILFQMVQQQVGTSPKTSITPSNTALPLAQLALFSGSCEQIRAALPRMHRASHRQRRAST